MSAEEKSIDLSEIQMERRSFDMSRASILLDDKKNEQTSQIKKEFGNDTANGQTKCDKKSQPAVGSFIKDLQRFQKGVDFESDVYDIYHNTTNSMWRYKHKVNQILDNKVTKQQNKQLNEYIFDFKRHRNCKSNTTKRSAHSVKQKLNAHSPKSPKLTLGNEERPKRRAQVCGQYYILETPRSQQQQNLQKKKRNNNSSSNRQLRSPARLISYQFGETQRHSTKGSKGFSKIKSPKARKMS